MVYRTGLAVFGHGQCHRSCPNSASQSVGQHSRSPPKPDASIRQGSIVSELFYKERFNTPTGWMLLVTDPSSAYARWSGRTKAIRCCAGRCGFTTEKRATGWHTRRLSHRRDWRSRLILRVSWRAITALRTETRGTTLQRAVWSALRNIPAGATAEFMADCLREMGNPTRARGGCRQWSEPHLCRGSLSSCHWR